MKLFLPFAATKNLIVYQVQVQLYKWVKRAKGVLKTGWRGCSSAPMNLAEPANTNTNTNTSANTRPTLGATCKLIQLTFKPLNIIK